MNAKHTECMVGSSFGRVNGHGFTSPAGPQGAASQPATLNPGWREVCTDHGPVIHVRTYCEQNLREPLPADIARLLPISCTGLRVWRHESGDVAVWCGLPRD